MRSRATRLAAVVALVLLAGGCGGTDDAAPDSTMTSATPVGDATQDDEGAADLDASLPGDARVPEPPSDLTLPPASTPPTSAPPAATATPTEAGEYTFAVTGTVGGEPVLGASTLSVSAVDGARRQSHVERTPGGRTTSVYRYAEDGRYLESVTISTRSRDLVLVAEEPFLLVPAGARAGTSTSGRLSGEDAQAQVTYRLIELDAERMIHQTVTRLAARVDPTCLLTGVVSTTAASRTSDQLPLDIRTESDMETSGAESCSGRTQSRIRSQLDR